VYGIVSKMSQNLVYFAQKSHSPCLKLPNGTGDYTHLLNNRVNKPIAYITSLFGISFQSASFYSHFIVKTQPAFIQKIFSYNKRKASL
jgi:hypothetical protein